MIVDHAYDLVTDDLFLRLDGLLPHAELFLKLEGLNPAGSVKLKTATGLVEDAERRGVLRPGGSLIESSSGNLGIALSAVCAAKGYTFTCVTDPHVPRQSVALMRAFGAHVCTVDTRDGNGGYLGSRIALIRSALDLDPTLTWLNQYANPANPAVHAARTAAAVLREIRTVDYLFVGAGTTGTVMGCAAHFRRHSPRTTVVAVDAEGSVTFGGPPGPRRIPGLGTSRVPEICRPREVHRVVSVPERDAVLMCRRLARSHGLAVGGSTGSVLSAVLRLRSGIPPGARVVALSADLGERYLDTVYDDAWVTGHFGAAVAGRSGRSRHSGTTQAAPEEVR
ncbi:MULTISPECIES: 2,3-diaminopropionate biosynthesis protein SbnA [Streptomyces]|uniref:2,3-diaminopropionate biosynthesis protein SbnA n=1 Tax=Streptomyces TaxID=1883 RepID=UPI0004CDB459|nr:MULTISPECIES: 2,3-diaminopropionate biosynthesis protein SbnA [Streptomyces]KOT49016.1 cysteine synthase [Streptomyces rimosus subsp. rimosus]